MLRSGRRSTFYLDKYRGLRPTPSCCASLGARLAETVARRFPRATRLAAPEPRRCGRRSPRLCRLRPPFVIVRGQAKEYGTANRLEGTFSPGERVCLLEDVVTSGGAAAEAVAAVRDAGLECSNAVCVVDREEGGADALARLPGACGRCFERPTSRTPPKIPAKPAWLSQSGPVALG